MGRLKVGDRVRITSSAAGGEYIGAMGVIAHAQDDLTAYGWPYSVDLDEPWATELRWMDHNPDLRWGEDELELAPDAEEAPTP